MMRAGRLMQDVRGSIQRWMVRNECGMNVGSHKSFLKINVFLSRKHRHTGWFPPRDLRKNMATSKFSAEISKRICDHMNEGPLLCYCIILEIESSIGCVIRNRSRRRLGVLCAALRTENSKSQGLFDGLHRQ